MQHIRVDKTNIKVITSMKEGMEHAVKAGATANMEITDRKLVIHLFQPEAEAGKGE